MAALNKMEMLPGRLGTRARPANEVPQDAASLLDRVAGLTQDDQALAELRDTYETKEMLRPADDSQQRAGWRTRGGDPGGRM
jgi:hypothetical protein